MNTFLPALRTDQGFYVVDGAYEGDVVEANIYAVEGAKIQVWSELFEEYDIRNGMIYELHGFEGYWIMQN
ncbi:hypothetical protein NVP2117O_52 [Vibrio phage 2.117.O._10N.261.45.E9]|nr:hypothetical protein NVP1117O_52 [Vibrio phage 1.117.O._10N.261.45.E9]AUR95453.1 hypothetical protein NVP1207B_46 [Vibrio phage 1.207.B._10N.222.51.C2]AUS02344.1 hypothetical protein NVP2117O_52 [Vibrio phage 2.117.O._10N.261.45.E9]